MHRVFDRVIEAVFGDNGIAIDGNLVATNHGGIATFLDGDAVTRVNAACNVQVFGQGKVKITLAIVIHENIAVA